jgi:hypothetical protein
LEGGVPVTLVAAGVEVAPQQDRELPGVVGVVVRGGVVDGRDEVAPLVVQPAQRGRLVGEPQRRR